MHYGSYDIFKNWQVMVSSTDWRQSLFNLNLYTIAEKKPQIEFNPGAVNVHSLPD